MISKKTIIRSVFGFIIIFIIMVPNILAGNVYYIDSTNGNDNNDGLSTSAAWKTISKANSTLLPGDTVHIRTGAYDESIRPTNSGTPGNYITYQNYIGESPVITRYVQLTGWINHSGSIYKTNIDESYFYGVWEDDYAKSGYYVTLTPQDSLLEVDEPSESYIDTTAKIVYVWLKDGDNPNRHDMKIGRSIGVNFLSNTDYIKVDGIIIRWTNEGVKLLNCDHNIFQNCVIEYAFNPGFEVVGTSAYNKFLSNKIWNVGPWYAGIGDGFRIGGTANHNLLENNDISVVSHNGITSYGISPEYNIIQHNKVYEVYHSGLNINVNPYKEVWRRNISHGNGSSGLQTDSGDCIISFNIFYHNGWIGASASDGLSIYSTSRANKNHKFFHNVIVDSQKRGVAINNWGGICEDDIFKNNIIYDNKDSQHNSQLRFDGKSSINSNVYSYNCIYRSDVVNVRSYDEGTKTLTWMEYNYSSNFINNVQQDPSFDATYHLNAYSPCINSGNWLTVITSSGSGNQIPVEDAGYFCDGFGIIDGDLIQLEGQTQTAKITNVDYDSNVITVDNPLSWYSGQGVSMPYYGYAPDIGAYEYYETSTSLTASMDASPGSGFVPLSVSFTGSATGGSEPYTYNWDFGDGGSSADQNPSHTYSEEGDYTVIFTVTDDNSQQDTDSIIINASEETDPLEASCSASPVEGEIPFEVTFTGSASGGTAPYSYSWNFGDGASSTAKNPSHTYTQAGTYIVTLTVTDSTASQASASTTISAQAQIPALAASCTASPTSGDIPLTVNFIGSAAGGIPPYSYSWNFGDGTSSTAQNPSHTYTQAGSYTATLTVTDSIASQAIASTEVSASSPVHEVTAPDTPEGPSTGAPGVLYTYTTGGSSCSQGHSVEYYFDWGDGAYSSWSSSTSASHIWSTASTYAVKVQARCSVNPGVTSMWSAAKTVSLEESPNFQLYISSATASPAPGQGGSTNPDTGSYPYPAGNTAQVTALPATNYRFSKWTGDITGSDSYNSEITFNMDQDKSISALFCTQCGDVNGDLNITPADAQDAFEMFLGIISSTTETQKENADVNCDGTAIEPNITPGDAQAIFVKFLGISELPGDCSCRSRADASSSAFSKNNQSQIAPSENQPGMHNINLSIDDIDARFKREITVPVRINNPLNVKSFGFDLAFDSGTFEFAGIETGSLFNNFTKVDANEISEGVVRIGGFSSEPILTSSPSVLVRLKFRVSGRVKEPSSLSITNTVDDIKNATTKSGVVFIKNIKNKIKRNRNVY